jgi:hypothetical protein
MSSRHYSIFDTIIARISQGSVPFDAVYWIDPDQERGASVADSVAGSDRNVARARSQWTVPECATCD